MKILLTGATGYIGQRLLPVLTAAEHEVSCLVRDARRFALPDTLPLASTPRCRLAQLALPAPRGARCHVLPPGRARQPACLGQRFDVGGPDVLTYREMLLGLAAARGHRRYLLTVPVLTPRLSSWWLYLVTSTSFSLAQSLVESLKNDTVVDPSRSIARVVPHACMSYRDALALAFRRIEQNEVVSSWSDAMSSGTLRQEYMNAIQIPRYGMFFDRQLRPFTRPVAEVLDNIWRLGGNRGCYKTDWLWQLRGLLDKVVGGVDRRRGRRSPNHLRAGDPLDFWRVRVADRAARRLLLYAEMKLPGEAWLQFRILDNPDGTHTLEQLASYRPQGLLGRLYWHAVLPFHGIIFKGMVKNLIRYGQ